MISALESSKEFAVYVCLLVFRSGWYKKTQKKSRGWTTEEHIAGIVVLTPPQSPLIKPSFNLSIQRLYKHVV